MNNMGFSRRKYNEKIWKYRELQLRISNEIIDLWKERTII